MIASLGFLWSYSLILSAIAAPMPNFSPNSLDVRSTDTCADPSLATTFMQVFNRDGITHALGPRAYTISGTTNEGATQWEFQGDIFVAWSTEQEFTVPLYRYDLSNVLEDFQYSTATSIPGWIQRLVIGYVYETQVCGSVPLLGAYNQANTDHYYTTVFNEHSELIAISGWTDAGIAGYVLPLGTGKSNGAFFVT
ncbi:hypothetical protein CVT26_014612 [Gymnopilus dilepis]|uniref:DUF5648 domain-containing protein n=1 Tax=Gymnopilus dilepis TaxID=231916 RepID=A0A409VWQ8_9AGAR|nr:hypothetical protein CVT26_014612 [Gymnopilus dilepis]